jgi:hypothetical protein
MSGTDQLRAPKRRARLAGAVIAATIATLTGAASASATTFTVSQTADTAPATGTCSLGACSLRQAVEAAGDGDGILLPASATPYTLTNGQLVVAHAIAITGGGAASSVIEAQDADRVLLVAGNDGAVRLTALAITGGNATTRNNGGGGIADAGPGPLDLAGVAVSGNVATPPNESSDEGGGGIFASGPLVLDHSSVTGNTTTVTQSDGDSGGGGILQKSGNLTLTDSTVAGNTATVTPSGTGGVDNNGGGGIYMDGSELTITGSLIQGNTTTVASTPVDSAGTPADGGGGIYQFGNDLVLRDSTVAGNAAHGPGLAKGGGGGVFDDGDTSQYVNDTIAANTTDEPAATTTTDSDGGGGVLLDAVLGGVTMANLTVDGNSAPNAVGGGINDVLDTHLELTDSIVAGNTDSTHPASVGNCIGPISSDGYNLTDDATASNTCGLGAAGDLLATAPALGALTANGGPTPTQALGAGSPAINAGNPLGCTDLAGVALLTDQRGAARPETLGGRCDIGAFEAPAPAPAVVTLPPPVVNLPAPSVAPSARTAAPKSVKPYTAILEGAVDPNGQSTSVHFQYGTSARYGSVTPSHTVAASAGAVVIGTTVTHLLPGRLYHVRVVAKNATGTTAGADVTFTTRPRAEPAAIPTAESPASDPTAPFLYTVKGSLVLPPGLGPTAGCKGSVTVRARSGATSISAHGAVNIACHFTVTVRLHGLKLARHGSAQITTRYTGTTSLAPRSAPAHTVTFG